VTRVEEAGGRKSDQVGEKGVEVAAVGSMKDSEDAKFTELAMMHEHAQSSTIGYRPKSESESKLLEFT
jgi:hypothetical protein